LFGCAESDLQSDFNKQKWEFLWTLGKSVLGSNAVSGSSRANEAIGSIVRTARITKAAYIARAPASKGPIGCAILEPSRRKVLTPLEPSHHPSSPLKLLVNLGPKTGILDPQKS
jgi:hypothetical protein